MHDTALRVMANLVYVLKGADMAARPKIANCDGADGGKLPQRPVYAVIISRNI